MEMGDEAYTQMPCSPDAIDLSLMLLRVMCCDIFVCKDTEG